ncbi:MAG: tRNA pseudouridine(38-40) synthase TruA [Dehalococcoidia bacterium]
MNWSSKFVLVVEYDGTRYYGFQWQLALPTIQNELEQAIRRSCGQSSRVIAASRTDAGVHAKGQVVSFWADTTLDGTTLVKALNYYLPHDIAVKAAYRAAADFSVRRDAVSREYRYYILNSDTRSPFSRRFASFVPKRLDVEVMNQACHLVEGEHDFASFASSTGGSKSTLRNVYEAGIEKRGDFIIFRIVANSFLPHQIRSTVGLLVRLGLGKITIQDFRDIMEAKSLGLAGPLSPACGLCLNKVNYSKPLGN